MRFNMVAIVLFGLALVWNPRLEGNNAAMAAPRSSPFELVSATPVKRFLRIRASALPARVAIIDGGKVKRVASHRLRLLDPETLVLVDQAGSPKDGVPVIVAELL